MMSQGSQRRRPAVVFTTIVLALAAPAASSDVRQCASVLDGSARVLAFEAENAAGRALRVEAVLIMPRGSGPHPAVILLPGGGGMSVPRCYRLAMEEFVSWGYAALLVDSNSGITSEGTRLSSYSFADQAAHARAAADHLAVLPEIDKRRIGAWGFSHGGLSAIEAIAGTTEGTIRAVVASSPICPARVEPPATPLLIMIGADDSQVSVDACLSLAERLRDVAGFEFLLLPESDHFYEMPNSPQYNEAAARLAARQMQGFLARYLAAPK